VRIRILSDLHLEHHAPPDGLHVSSGNTVDVVVLAGDIGRGADPLRWAHHTFPDVPVLFVAGNHEFYDRHLDATLPALRRASDPIPDGRAAAPERSGIYLLQRRAIQIGDVRFLGCTFWTDFSLFSGRRAEAVAACRANMDDYRRIHLLRARRRLRPRDTDRHHRTSVNWLRREREAATSARATVIVTHHAPSRQSIDPRYERALTSAAFVADRDALVRELGPALWIHGHVHASFEYQIGQTRILANPRGHPDENPAFQISRTVEV
jgi:predicted phosphodiesterase